jgi:hypothetical protein
MSKSVWVIEKGSYSDYRVVGVYTSEEKARIVCDAINKTDGEYDEAEIAEWPLDPAADEINQGMTQYLVYMRRDGTAERCEPRSLSAYGIGEQSYIWKRSDARAFQGVAVADVLVSTVFATDEKHAIKVANERRMQMIAMNQWEPK